MTTDPANLPVENNEDESRFETTVDGYLAFAEYRLSGDSITFTHTLVPNELEGRGIGSKLAKTALDYAQSEHLGVVPICPFITAYIKRHREYVDLVLPEFRSRVSS